jgi:hypothetical protein
MRGDKPTDWGIDFLLWRKFPKQDGQGNFWKFVPKNCPILNKKVMKLPRFLEHLGRFLTFFLLQLSYLANRFWWYSQHVIEIPRFFTSLFFL